MRKAAAFHLQIFTGHHAVGVIRGDGKNRLPDDFLQRVLGDTDIVVPPDMGNIGKFFRIPSLDAEEGLAALDGGGKLLVCLQDNIILAGKLADDLGKQFCLQGNLSVGLDFALRLCLNSQLRIIAGQADGIGLGVNQDALQYGHRGLGGHGLQYNIDRVHKLFFSEYQFHGC